MSYYDEPPPSHPSSDDEWPNRRNGSHSIDLPDGLRLWSQRDDAPQRPRLPPAAYHGPIGEYLEAVEGETEAHPAAIGAELLAHSGLMIGRSVAARLGEIRQPPVLFVAVVGASLTGAKGTAATAARGLLDLVDRDHRRRHDLTGTSSGEAVIYALRDPNDDDTDSRSCSRIMADAELGAMLTAAGRDGSILSATLRKAWDLEPLRHESRTNGATTANGYMLSICGSITPHELRAGLSALDLRNGFANRLLYVHGHAVDRLPFGGTFDPHRTEPIAAAIVDALDRAHQRPRRDGRTFYELHPDTRPAWSAWYHDLKDRAESAGEYARPSLHATQRAIPYTLRLALIFAVLDQADSIERRHLEAAQAWITYAIDTAEHVFDGHAIGDAGLLLENLRAAGPKGMTLTEIRDLFHRNRNRSELEDIRAELVADLRAWEVKEPPAAGRGRPVIRVYATTPSRGAVPTT